MSPTVATTPVSLAATVGRPGPEHIEYAKRLRQSIPDTISIAAHEPTRAYLLTLALIVDPAADAASPQFDLLRKKLGDERANAIRGYHTSISKMGDAYRLPLLEIAFPALKRLPAQRLEFLLDMARDLIEVDGVIDFYEFCVFRILSRTLSQAMTPAARQRKRRPASRSAVRSAATQVLSLLADRGHESLDEKRAAFKAGLSVFGDWSGEVDFTGQSIEAVALFDQSLDVLQRMNSAATQSLLEAINITAKYDGQVSTREAEMIRAICASLDCPLPPLLTQTLGNL